MRLDLGDLVQAPDLAALPGLARLRVLDLSNAVLGKEESGDDVVLADGKLI